LFREKNIFYLFVLFLTGWNSFAQDLTAARYEIDAKRIGVYPSEKDALPRSREFIRLDSTYYVGWMYEGMYKFERSADYFGYQYATVPLRKALHLFEKDFGHKMRNLFSSYTFFQQNLARYDDFYQIVNTLKLCYNSIEMPDSTMALLDKFESYQFQKDFMSVNTERSWIYHRNRFFTSKEHPFLKNSVEENEKLAFHACYLQITDIKRNKAVNDAMYGGYQSSEDYLTVYHYLALLHNYNRQYDSAEYYYNLLAEGGRISWSNYANMQHEVGNFAEAISYYKKPQYRRRFSLVEADYYLPMMYIYSGRTKDALELSKQKIIESGSAPGFGWYTIGLARGYLYDGQLDSAEFFLDKASNFKELHINTTLTQSQYEFTINLLRIQLLDKKLALVKFFNTGWWYNISDLYDMLMLKIEKVMLEYAVVNATAKNPERTRIIYDLFCAETTVTYDESVFLLKDFSVPFFKKKYENYRQTDPRRKIDRYFAYYGAKFVYEGGDKEEAAILCEELMRDCLPQKGVTSDNPYYADEKNEKLLKARLCEIMSNGFEGAKQEAYIQQFYETYPQLVPFSGAKMKMNVLFTGDTDETINKVIDDLKDCDIEMTNESGIPQAEINFIIKNGAYIAKINVRDASGNDLVLDQQVVFKLEKGVGRELALRLFAKGGAIKI
jgi:hypothetical protein